MKDAVSVDSLAQAFRSVLNRYGDFLRCSSLEVVAYSKMGPSNWAKIEIGAGECNVPSLFAPDARGSLQRFVGDFVSQDFIFRPVDSDRGGVAHRYPPRCPVRSRLMKGIGMNPSVA